MIQPTEGKVALRPISKEDQVTEGGIYLPDSGGDETRGRRAVVVAVGPAGRGPHGGMVPPGDHFTDEQCSRKRTLRPGDVVLVSAYAGTEVLVDADPEPHVVVDQGEVLAVLKAADTELSRARDEAEAKDRLIAEVETKLRDKEIARLKAVIVTRDARLAELTERFEDVDLAEEDKWPSGPPELDLDA